MLKGKDTEVRGHPWHILLGMAVTPSSNTTSVSEDDMKTAVPNVIDAGMVIDVSPVEEKA